MYTEEKLSDKKDGFNIKAAIKGIRQDERNAVYKAEHDARLAIKEAAEAKERELLLARETEIKTIRDMRQQFDSSIASIREEHRRNLDEIKKTRADAVAAAKDMEERTIREAYDAESQSIAGADTKTIRKIKYDTLKKVQEARDTRERTVRDALFEEEHAVRKAEDIAYRDMQREKEMQKRTQYRTTVNARDAGLQAARDADLREKKAVSEILSSYRENVIGIRKNAQDEIRNLKKSGVEESRKEEIPSFIPVEELPEEKSKAVPEAKIPEEANEKAVLRTKEVPVKEPVEKDEVPVEETATEDEPSMKGQPSTAEQDIDSLTVLANTVMKDVKKVKADRESAIRKKTGKEPSITEPATEKSSAGNNQNIIAEPVVESAPKEDKARIVPERTGTPKSKATLYSGIVRIAVKSPAEPYKIKLFGDKLNNIENVKILFIGGEINRNTIIDVELEKEVPLIDILSSLPEVADVSLKDKDNIQLVLKADS
jgi:hypothetical protein